ncbi:hypothetical protein LJB98_05040 [Bacteroidales bacterium OttesenSCG-928-M11]|nr:hypothetical protein [Bacteroidales bacterium OttesenSCG-928-M11]
MVNFLFLTHALLPHHHHDGLPHFIFSDHHNTLESNHQDCCCSDEPKSCEDSCALDSDIDVIVSDEEDSYALSHCTDKNCSCELYLQAILFTFIYDFAEPDKTDLLRQAPYLISTYQEYVNQSFGLRAPPIV